MTKGEQAKGERGTKLGNSTSGSGRGGNREVVRKEISVRIIVACGHDTDPTEALTQHLRVNQPSSSSHLFAYKAANTRRPLTKSKFLERVGNAARATGLELLQGHRIRIGSTLEYLLRGVPFDVMKAKGHWAGDSFQLYLRKHAVVIAPYIQATPLHEGFVRYTMPPVR